MKGKPDMLSNYSKLAALFRTLVILGASSFCGALVLPLTTSGTLPTTWDSWKPILAVAASAAVVSEFIWIRTHIQQAAQAIGVVANDATTPPAIKAALLKAGLGVLVCLGVLCAGCTKSQLTQAETDTGQAIDLTDAVCSLAPDSPVGQPYVDVICALAETGEQLVSVVIGDIASLGSASSTSSLRVPVKQIRFSVPTTSAAKFLVLHGKK